jgi:hypothetical protein
MNNIILLVTFTLLLSACGGGSSESNKTTEVIPKNNSDAIVILTENTVTVNENSTGNLYFSVDYTGSNNLTKSVNSNNDLVSVSISGDQIHWSTKSVTDLTTAIITLEVSSGNTSAKKNITMSINDNSLAVNLSKIDSLSENSTQSLSFNQSYTGNEAVIYSISSSNNAYSSVAIDPSNHEITINTHDIKGAKFKNVTITLDAIAGDLSSSDSVTFSVLNNTVNTLSINTDNTININDNSVLTQEVIIEYSDTFPLSYSVTSSNNNIVSASFNGSILTLSSAEITSNELVTVTLSATDGTVTENKNIVVNVIDDDIVLHTEVNVDSSLSEKKSYSYNVVTTYNGTNNISYTVSSSNNAIATASMSGATLNITTKDINGKESDAVSFVIIANDGEITDSIMIETVILNDSPNTITLEGLLDATVDENSTSSTALTVNYSDSYPITYTATSSDPSVLDVSFDGQALSLTTKEISKDTLVNITVTATDGTISTTETAQITITDLNPVTLSFTIEALSAMEEAISTDLLLAIDYTGEKKISKNITFTNSYINGSITSDTLTLNTENITGGDTEITGIEVTITDGNLIQTKNFTITINNTSYASTVETFEESKLLAIGMPNYSESTTLLNFLTDKSYLDQNIDNVSRTTLLNKIKESVSVSWVALQVEIDIIKNYDHANDNEYTISLAALNWQLTLDNYISAVKVILADLNSQGMNLIANSSINTLKNNGVNSSLYYYNINLGSSTSDTWIYRDNYSFLDSIIPESKVCYTSPL